MHNEDVARIGPCLSASCLSASLPLWLVALGSLALWLSFGSPLALPLYRLVPLWLSASLALCLSWPRASLARVSLYSLLSHGYSLSAYSLTAHGLSVLVTACG